MTTRYKKYITNRAEDLRTGKLGRRLVDLVNTMPTHADFASLLNADEQLYMLLWRGEKHAVPCIVVRVSDEGEYDHFFGPSFALYAATELYAVPNSAVVDPTL